VCVYQFRHSRSNCFGNVSKADAKIWADFYSANIFYFFFKKKSSDLCPMKCLIIQTAFIGDVILATPLIEQLHRCHPALDIHLLVRRGNEALLAEHPHLKRVWVWDKKNGKYRGLWRLLRDIRRERFDWVINCQRFAASGFLTAFSGAPVRIGFDKNPFSRGFTVRVPHRFGTAEAPLHEVERNLALVRALTDERFQRPVLYPRAQDRARAAELRPPQPYICIAPTSVWFTKQLPADKWLELIALIPADTAVLLLGAPDDRAACEAILRQCQRPQVYNLAGELGLLASAALMQGARMNYVNDSAPMHLASAVNAPVTAVFCSTVPAFGFGPLSDERQILETQIPLACRPCGLHGYKACPEEHFNCARQIRFEPLPE
jgi:heptosyltransferase II